MRDTVTDFTGSLTNELSLPSELMVFLNLLLFGNSCDEFGFSLPLKANAQIILYNVKVGSDVIQLQHTNDTMRRENPHFYYILA